MWVRLTFCWARRRCSLHTGFSAETRTLAALRPVVAGSMAVGLWLTNMRTRCVAQLDIYGNRYGSRWGQGKRAGSSHTPEMVTMVLTAEVAIAVTLGSFRFCVVVISTLAYAKG